MSTESTGDEGVWAWVSFLLLQTRSENTGVHAGEDIIEEQGGNPPP